MKCGRGGMRYSKTYGCLKLSCIIRRRKYYSTLKKEYLYNFLKGNECL